MQPQLRSTIDVTPLVGLLLAVLALVFAAAPDRHSFVIFDMTPTEPAFGEAPRAIWHVSVDKAGEIWLALGESNARRVTPEELQHAVPTQEPIYLRATAEARYGAFAELASYLDANGRRIVLMNEELD